MFTPVRLKVEGFRGFRDAQEFTFDAPVTSLFGDNRSGKSSLLNALEWALFGDACSGKQTGIRERVGWNIPNQHLPTPGVYVELEMESQSGSYLLRRSLRRPARKTTLEEKLELNLPDGTTLTDSVAAERLAGVLPSFRDFLTTVYQHQESIRAVLTQEPRDRNDAIDRLLGLASQRNLLGALDDANLRAFQKEIGQRFDDFEQQVQTALSARENDLAELLQQAAEAGLSRNRLTARVALQGAQSVAESVKQFALEAELEAPDLQVPDNWIGLAEFDRATKKTVSRLRGQVPGITEQQKLLTGQKKLLTLQTRLERIRERWTEISQLVRGLDREHGGRKAVDKKIADANQRLETEQDRLRQTSGRAAVINEAIQFLESTEDEDAPCPVCGKDTPCLLDQIRRLWTEKLQSLVASITERIEEWKAQLKKLRTFAASYTKLNEEAEQLQQDQGEVHGAAVTLLGRELGKDDDLLATVNSELKRLERRLTQLAQAIQQRQERLDAIESDLVQVRLIREYLQMESKKQVIETIQNSEAFHRLESLRDQIAEVVEDAESLKDAIATVSREEADARLTAAEQTIDEYFRQLSRNPAVQHLKLGITTNKRTHCNAYELTDQDGKDLTPILSQGDLNALALAIFLGLSATASESGAFDFLMLDDPSQSLGTEHKKQLARLLDQVARQRKLIVATMDAEFHQFLMESLTRAKTGYHFGKWTPAKGPSISTHGEPSGRAIGNHRR